MALVISVGLPRPSKVYWVTAALRSVTAAAVVVAHGAPGRIGDRGDAATAVRLDRPGAARRVGNRARGRASVGHLERVAVQVDDLGEATGARERVAHLVLAGEGIGAV